MSGMNPSARRRSGRSVRSSSRSSSASTNLSSGLSTMPANCSPWRSKKTIPTPLTKLSADLAKSLRAKARLVVSSFAGCSLARWTPTVRISISSQVRRRHRGAGLGGDDLAHVPALGRVARIQGGGHRSVSRRSCRHQECNRFISSANTPTAGCVPRPAYIASFANRRLIPATAPYVVRVSLCIAGSRRQH